MRGLSMCQMPFGFKFGVAVGGLTEIDWTIIVLYALGMIGLGWHFGRRQRSTQEYFIGSGKMDSRLIGVSLFATLVSTITYLSQPGEMIAKGPATLAGMAAYPIAFLIVGYVFIPVYMRQRVTSAYELLEVRLGVGIRLLGASMFIVLRLVWMSLLVYLAAKAMTVIFGIEPEQQSRWIPWIVLGTGFVAVIYTSLGGLRAVVVTDFVQTTVMLVGALLVITMVTVHFGGFQWFPTEWQPNWDRQPLFSFDPKTRLTMTGSVLLVLTWFVCTAGGDQTAVQRFMSTRDARAARRSYLYYIIANVLVGGTLAMVGFALHGYFHANPDQLPVGINLTNNADKVFPRYVAFHLPSGASGLVVAALFAAAMSSLDSGINSITAVVSTDFLDRFGKRPGSDRAHVLMVKMLAFGIGTIVVIGSSFIGNIAGNITEVTNKTANLLVTPIFALFFFALFVPFARPAGVLAGAICGITTAVLIAFSGPIFGPDPVTGQDPISFMWISPTALLVNLLVGTVVSLLWSRAKGGSKQGVRP